MSEATTTTFTVRDARPDELAGLRDVASRAFDRFDMLLYSTRGREVLVAVDADEQPLGGVVLHATPRADRPAPHGRLGVVHFIFVDPDIQVSGIGTALRQAADQRFDALGCTETSARIDATNSASQALHRAGGYQLADAGDQLRRWGWRLPLRWLQAGHGLDPGMQLWLRPATRPDRPHHTGRALAGTWLLNLLLLTVVAWRAPRGEAGALVTVVSLAGALAVLLGAREAAIRLVARRAGTRLQHAAWPNGIGLAGALAAAVGVWFPLTGSSTPQQPGWRHDRHVPLLGKAHLAGGLVVATLAWATILIDPPATAPVWDEIRRAALMLALVDLVVPYSPMIGNAARHVRRWSTPAWLLLALAAATAQTWILVTG